MGVIGVAVLVGVNVRDGVKVTVGDGEAVNVAEGVGVAVKVAVGLAVLVAVPVDVAVAVGVNVDVHVEVMLGVTVGVKVLVGGRGVKVAVGGLGVNVQVGKVKIRVLVGKGVGVAGGVAVAVAAATGVDCPTEVAAWVGCWVAGAITTTGTSFSGPTSSASGVRKLRCQTAGVRISERSGASPTATETDWMLLLGSIRESMSEGTLQLGSTRTASWPATNIKTTPAKTIPASRYRSRISRSEIFIPPISLSTAGAHRSNCRDSSLRHNRRFRPRCVRRGLRQCRAQSTGPGPVRRL